MQKTNRISTALIFGGIILPVFFSACGGLRGLKNPLVLQSSDVIDLSVDPNASPEIQAGQKLYGANCFKCHGNIYQSTKKDRSTQEIMAAIKSPKNPQMNHLKVLTESELSLIALALSPAAQMNCNSSAANFVNIHRLNKSEYANTFKDLFGFDYSPSAAFPAETRTPFSNTALALIVDPDLGNELFFQPIKVLDKVFASSFRSNVLSCDPDSGTTSGTGTVATGGKNPFMSIGALTYSSMSGIQDANGSAGYFNPGDFLKYDGLNFGTVGPTQLKLTVSVDPMYAGGRFDIRQNCTSNSTGTVIGSLTMQSTGSWDTFVERTITVTPITGMQNICIVAAVGPVDGIGNIKSFAFVGSQVFQSTPAPNTNLDHRACADKIIKEFGLKAFRRPLTTAENSQFLSLYDNTRLIYPGSGNGLGTLFEESIKAPLHAMLASPQFLYRIVEFPDGGLKKALNPYELAQRISYFIWGSTPDKTLLDLAATGKILERETILSQVERMLRDPKALNLVDSFAVQWFGVDKFLAKQKNATMFPEYTDSLKSAMLNESRMLFQEMIQNDFSLHHILTSKNTYLNEELARHYGVAGVTSGVNFTRVDMSSTPRRGLLGHASLHASTSNEVNPSIVKRGLFVLDQVICESVGSPPDNVPPLPEGSGGGELNPRQLLEQHIRNPACATCHTKIDPPGLVLEAFDAVGKFRTKYSNGDVIDTSGQLPSGFTLNSVNDLVEYISKGTKFNLCSSKRLMTYALGKYLGPSETCASNKLGFGFGKATDKFSDLVKQIVLSEQFLNQGRGE